MADVIDLSPALSFLAALAKNNSKPWFEAHREQYDEALAAFHGYVARVLEGMAAFEDVDGLTPKNTVMRIYRDVRFSKDKTPYKDGLGAHIVHGGRRSGWFGYYIHVQPGNESMLACGLYEPTPDQLARYRTAVAKDAAPLRKILAAPGFRKHFDGLWGESLKTAPKGFAADHPDIDLLKRKQVCVTEGFKDAEVKGGSFAKLTVESFKAMKPLLDWINDAAAD